MYKAPTTIGQNNMSVLASKLSLNSDLRQKPNSDLALIPSPTKYLLKNLMILLQKVKF